MLSDTQNFSEYDTFVCENCVEDKALAKLVQQNLLSKKCDYCEEESEENIAAPFNIIMERIYASISTKYADAQDIDLPWVDGGWILDETDTYEVVGDFDPGWGGKFLDDIINSLDPWTYWVRHSNGDWTELNPSRALSYGWSNFKRQVLTKTRYLFLSEPDDEINSMRPDHIPISYMLDALGSIFNNLNLITTERVNGLFYRVRVANDDDVFDSFDHIGVPPEGIATAGRMNPAGISYFYIAKDPQTAVNEVVYKQRNYFIGTFKNKKELKLINFVNLPKFPSLFEPSKYEKRHSIKFLYMLRDDLTKPIEKDGREHIDYIPTQIVSEYFRYRFLTIDGLNVDGFMYPSTKNKGGVNIAIFDSCNESLKEKFELVTIQKC